LRSFWICALLVYSAIDMQRIRDREGYFTVVIRINVVLAKIYLLCEGGNEKDQREKKGRS
jgi:hypothetical protein